MDTGAPLLLKAEYCCSFLHLWGVGFPAKAICPCLPDKNVSFVTVHCTPCGSLSPWPLLYFISCCLLQQQQQQDNPPNLLQPPGLLWRTAAGSHSPGCACELLPELFQGFSSLVQRQWWFGVSTWPHAPLWIFCCLEAASNLSKQWPLWPRTRGLPSVQTCARWAPLAVLDQRLI